MGLFILNVSIVLIRNVVVNFIDGGMVFRKWSSLFMRLDIIGLIM